MSQREPSDENSGIILPAQYFDKSRRHKLLEGEYRLLLAVLEQALHLYLASMCRHTVRQRLLFEELRKWFYASGSATRNELFAFESICGLLDIDADALRARLRAVGVQQLPIGRRVRHLLAPGERRRRRGMKNVQVAGLIGRAEMSR